MAEYLTDQLVFLAISEIYLGLTMNFWLVLTLNFTEPISEFH